MKHPHTSQKRVMLVRCDLPCESCGGTGRNGRFTCRYCLGDGRTLRGKSVADARFVLSERGKQ